MKKAPPFLSRPKKKKRKKTAMEKKTSGSRKPDPTTESTRQPTHHNSDSDDNSSPSPLHSSSSTHSPLHSPSPQHQSSPSLSKAIVPVDYNYSVTLNPSPTPQHENPSPPPFKKVNKVRRPRRSGGGGNWLDRAALGFRVAEMGLCLVSFSVMAADRTAGWSGDSFDRYKEYRYCLSVTVIAFVYAGLQACSLSYLLITGNNVIKNQLRHHFEFAIDQILAYLLISASSSAATRVDDWQSNWGKDEFTIMASASVTVSFLAFAAFALSSLISGYNLCGRFSS